MCSDGHDCTTSHADPWLGTWLGRITSSASYRAGDWKDAIAALEKAEGLAPGKSLAYNAVFLAMAHWKLGEKDKARQWYDRAVNWMETNKPTDPEIVQFRAEAAQLLGIPLADPWGKHDDK